MGTEDEEIFSYHSRDFEIRPTAAAVYQRATRAARIGGSEEARTRTRRQSIERRELEGGQTYFAPSFLPSFLPPSAVDPSRSLSAASAAIEDGKA